MEKHTGKIKAFGHEYPCTVFLKTDLNGNVIPNRKADVRWYTHNGEKEQNRRMPWTTDQEVYQSRYGIVLIADMDTVEV